MKWLGLLHFWLSQVRYLPLRFGSLGFSFKNPELLELVGNYSAEQVKGVSVDQGRDYRGYWLYGY